MKKFILFFFCFLAALLLLAFVFIFTPVLSPPRYEKGPKVYYRVLEGSVDVFSLKDGRAGSLLSVVTAGETFTARPVSAAALKTPIWLDWMEPVIVAVVERTNLFMYKESRKSPYRNFAVGYTDDSIQRSLAAEIEKSRILSNVRIYFHADGFSLFAKSRFLSLSFRGYASTQGTSDRLFLRLRWVKVGEVFLPEHVLRVLENVFSKAYVASRHPSISLLKISFSNNRMVMYFQKEGGKSADIFSGSSSSAESEIFFPYDN